MIALLAGVSGAWATDVKIATFGQPVTKNGARVSDYEFKTIGFSGLADVTITAPNSDVTISYNTNATYGDGWVNDGYGYCLSLVTSNTNAHTVQLNAPSGYKIVGYSFLARSNSSSFNHVLTPAGGSSITSTTGGVWVTVKEILADNTTFTIQTQNGGNTLYIPQFTISLVANTKKVVDTKVTADKDNPIAFANIDEIADGATPVVLYNSGRGTYQFANPYDGVLGGYTSSTGIINTSSVKFLVEKSGSKYKIINVDSRKYIPASGNVTMLPSSVSGAPTFTTLDNDGTTYTFKSGNSSFNGNPGNYGSFCYWGSAADGNSAYQIMPIASEEAIEYTIPDLFFAPTAYYRIKAAGRGNYYLSAGSSDTYIKLTQDAFDHSGTQVWKTYLGSRGVKLYSMGVNKYVAFNTNRSVQGQAIPAFTDSEQAGYNFIPEDKGDGNYAFQALAPLGNTYLSNNGGVSTTLSMGYYTNYDAGAQLQFERVYRVTLQSDMGDILGYVYTDGSIAASDLYDYDYYISGVAKTKSEVVEAINAVTDDNLVIVCSHQRSATISTKAEIDPTKVYTLTVKRGKWLHAGLDNVRAYFSNATIQTFKEDNQWAFVTVDGGTTYYLYNVGKQRFVMSRLGGSNFLDSKYTMKPITIEGNGSNASYPIRLKDGDLYFNENSGNLIISTYSNLDDGNQFSIQAIDGVVFDPTEAQAAINAAANNVPFRVSPEPSGSFDQATYWYNVAMRPDDGNGGYFAYVPAGYFDSDPVNIPLNSTKGTKESTDNYRWCITGSATSGYRLFNKAAGPDKVFVFDGGGKMKAYSGNESASLFYLATANTPGNGSPTFVCVNTDNRPNRQSNGIASWGGSDTGSEFGFTFDEAYTDNNFFELYEEIVKPYMDAELNSSNYFCLTSAQQKTVIWNTPSRYSDGIEHNSYSHDEVIAMRNVLEAYLKKPIASIGVRLKNTNSSNYVSYGNPTWNAAGLICNEPFQIAEADLTSVLQFIPATEGKYYIYMPTMGKYVGQQSSGNIAFPLVDESSRAEFTLIPTNTPGVISIYNAASYVNSDFEGYLHSAGWNVPGVVNWQASNLSSYWQIENAGSISLDMITPTAVGDGVDVYMSYANNLGLPLKAPEDVSVWKVESQDSERALVTEVTSKEIPAGQGVILQGEKGSTIHMAVKTSTTEDLAGNILVAGDGSTTVAAGNFMLAYNSTDEIAKFYAIGSSGYVVPANKAYLPAMGDSNVKALALSFGDEVTAIETINNAKIDDASVYNLAGQRVEKAVKGIYIVNGKKIIVK